MEDHQQDQFKTPQEFTRELDELEKYNNAGPDAYSRMSLFQAFDPLVALGSKTPHVQSVPAALNAEFDGETAKQEAPLNESSTLIHINTPASKHRYSVEDDNSLHDAANGHYKVDEILVDNADNVKMEQLFNEVMLINEQITDLLGEQLQTSHQQFINNQAEEDRLLAEKNNLIDELNKVEKNYFDTHSRYENMRTIVKEMDTRDAINKDKVLELSDKLMEKEQECRKWQQMAEAQSANLQMQSAAAKETVSLKAQVKVLEMKLNSLHSQIEQKNRENEELSHIVEELIGKQN